MGTFNVYIGVGHPDGGDVEQVLALVDTGSTHSMMPASLLEWLGIRPAVQRPVWLADDRSVLQNIGQGRFSYQGEEWTCPVVFGPEDQYLLGATTLEAFALVVDPGGKELIPAQYVARPF